MKKILVTGSAGFIGSWLRAYFEKHNTLLVPYDIKDAPEYDVKDIKMLKTYIKDVEGIVHLAAVSRVITAQEQPHECISTNIGGVSNVLEVARIKNDNPPATITFTSFCWRYCGRNPG